MYNMLTFFEHNASRFERSVESGASRKCKKTDRNPVGLSAVQKSASV